MYLVLDQSDASCQNGDIEDSGMMLNSDSENLDEALRDCNKNIHTYYPLTDFRTGRQKCSVVCILIFVLLCGMGSSTC